MPRSQTAPCHIYVDETAVYCCRAQQLGQPDGGEHPGASRAQVQWPPQVTLGVMLNILEMHMKKVVIAVGSHFAGKSKTINKYLKGKLKIGQREHKFIRNNQNGFILSQSFEEAERDVDYVVKNYAVYELLVLAARPAYEDHSCLIEARAKFSSAGYRVSEVIINQNSDETYYEDRADEILKYLDN